MSNLNLCTTNNTKIGIIGFGHLGRAIASNFLNHGFNKRDILISYKGNPSTYKRIEESGFTECVMENARILNEADIVFITIRPQDLVSLKETTFSNKPLILSCMAGVSLEILNNLFKTSICRLMLSGPDTINKENGIATVFPYNEFAVNILNKMELRFFETLEEGNIDIFTTGVCLPAALLQKENETGIKEAICTIEKDYPPFTDIYAWAKCILPSFKSKREKDEYVNRMITKGGVTEAIIDSLKAGETFEVSLMNGIARSKEISNKIRDLILSEM